MKRDHGFLAAKIMALVAAALVFGCAPPATTSPAPNRAAALRSASGSAALVSTGDWSCPSGGNANVTLKDNIGLNGFDFSGNGDFTVCVSSSNGNSFKVTGTTDSRSICIYPMYEGNTGGPAMAAQPQCFPVTGSPILPTFSDATKPINYFVIVDANYSNALTSCLSDTTPCPPHSEGFVN